MVNHKSDIIKQLTGSWRGGWVGRGGGGGDREREASHSGLGKETKYREFPGGTMVRTLCFH